MELLKKPATKIVTLLMGVLMIVLATWLDEFLPSWDRVRLAIGNTFFENELTRPKDGFRFVLCWLDRDVSGDGTKLVSDALSIIEGTGKDIQLSQSARVVKASVDVNKWQKRARYILDDWKADLVVVGSVTESGELLNLWFLPREGDGTTRRRDPVDRLKRVDQFNSLNNVSLQERYREYLYVQTAIYALGAVVQLADTKVRRRVLEKLEKLENRLADLLASDAITKQSRHHGALLSAHGYASAILDKWDSGPKRSKQIVVDAYTEALNAYTEVLKKYTREDVLLDWAMTQNNLGNALADQGKREGKPELLEQALIAFNEALRVFTPEDNTSFQWAVTQNNLGNALQTLGSRKRGQELLGQAVDAYTEALRVFTPEEMSRHWAMTQHNLGSALADQGKREGKPELLEQAVHAYTEVLKVYTREDMPLDWAMTQNNLGSVLADQGKQEGRPELLEQAVHAYTEALRVFTPEDNTSFQWAMTKNNLGRTLRTQGEQEESEPKYLKDAVVAFNEALQVFTLEDTSFQWAMTKNNLGRTLRTQGEQEGKPELLEQALIAFNEALQVFTLEDTPFQWAVTQNNLGNTLQTLGERESGPEFLRQAVHAYTEALRVFSPRETPPYWDMARNNRDRARMLLYERGVGPKLDDTPG